MVLSQPLQCSATRLHAGRARCLTRLRLTGAAASFALLATGCGLFAPLPAPTTLDQRLAAFPTEAVPISQSVTVRWNEHQVPFVEAETDEDAAFVMGMVHAHLRLAQMAVVRRIVQGRLSESASLVTTELDAAIRTFDFYRATDEIYAALPPETRVWMDRYVAGINHYAERLAPEWRPHEFDVLDMSWEPWTAQDSIALGRAGGVDLNWSYKLQMLQIEDADTREQIAARLFASSQNGAATMRAMASDGEPSRYPKLLQFAETMGTHGRSGSNSLVIGSSRSASGAPMIANDPHLAFIFPNAWVIAGLRSPSYSVVGMMVPGTPVFGFGRNETIAWGGTNLRATTSQFVDVSRLPPTVFQQDKAEIGVRYWFDEEITVRRSPYGPVMSDLDAVAGSDTAFAIRWTGHTVTDETTALLGAMRARSVDEFRDAVSGFAFPPQTFLVADIEGQIAAVVAAKVPQRSIGDGYPPIISPEQSDADWRGFYTGADLPWETAPAEDFLASANNRPAPDGARPYGGIFPQDERLRRLRQLVTGRDRLGIDDLREIQKDIVSPLSLELITKLRPSLVSLDADDNQAEAIRAMLGWDGAYRAESQTALVFETFLNRLVPEIYRDAERQDERQVYEALGQTRRFLLEDIDALSHEELSNALGLALVDAAAVLRSGKTWGDIHRLRIAHLFGLAPVIGGRYLIEDLPISGSRETVMKTGHPLTTEVHDSFFGSQSRHISDLADPDRNYFVLLGGQDGWLNSSTFADQIDLWRRGTFIQVPLRRRSVDQLFSNTLTLEMR